MDAKIDLSATLGTEPISAFSTWYIQRHLRRLVAPLRIEVGGELAAVVERIRARTYKVTSVALTVGQCAPIQS